MGETGGGSIADHFGGLEDPRVERTKRHSLLAIITIALCEGICGADNWVESAELGRAHRNWYASFLALPYGIPAHDTFGRVFAALDPVQCEAGFRAWVHALVQTLGPQVIALDGKALRGAHNAGEPPLQMVSAWASEARLVLAQRAVPEKANELSALPEVLQMLAVEGCIVTIDALGTHAPMARQIVERGADYSTCSPSRTTRSGSLRMSRPSSRIPRAGTCKASSRVMIAGSMGGLAAWRSAQPGP